MHWLSWLAWRELWGQRWRSLLCLLALALGVGLVVATGSLAELLQASVVQPALPLGSPADLWLSSAYDVDYDLPAELRLRVEAVPGVVEAQPLLRRPVRVQTPATLPGARPRSDTLTLLGVDPAAYFAFHDLRLAAGALPTVEARGLVALAPWAFVRELSLGQPVTVTTASGDVALPIVGLIEAENLAAAQQGLVLYAPLDVMENWFGLQDAITALEVRLAPRTSLRRVRVALEQALGPAYAISASSQPGQGFQLWQQLILSALVFVDLLTLAGSIALVYAVFAAAARARSRQTGLLRAVGAVRRQVLALQVIEASALGLAGSGLGLILGLLFARVGAGLVLQDGALPAVPRLPLHMLLVAATMGLLVSLAGAIRPAIRAARQSPLAALHLAHPILVPHPGDDRIWPLLRPLGWLFPSEARLAAANLMRERGRALWMAGAMALILAMALGNFGVLSLLGQELAATFGRLSGGDYLLLPALTTISLRELAGQDTSDVPPLAPGLLAALEGMGEIQLMRGTTADIKALQVFPGQPTLLLDVEGYAQMGGFRFRAGDWPSALLTFRQGPAALLAPAVARRLNVDLDDSVMLDTPQGPMAFQVAGIGDSEFTTCILDLADGATYFGANEVNAVEVQLRPGADRAAVRHALLDAVQTHGGTLLSLEQASAQLRGLFAQTQLSISLLIGVTGLVAGLAVINAMLASVAERRREIGLLRAAGATRPQIRRLIMLEMALVGAAAALVGTGLGWGITVAFYGLAQAHLGLAGVGASSWGAWIPLLAASVAGLVLWPLLAMLGGLVPALYAARLPVVQALYETTPS